MVCNTFFNFFLSFNLQDYIFQFAKKCEITSFCMMSLNVDLDEAAKCVDRIAGLSITRRLMTMSLLLPCAL